MKNSTLLLLLISVSFIPASCRKHSDHSPVTPSPTGPYLYIGGAANNKSIYWKKSLSQSGAAIVPDTLADKSIVTDILTVGNDVYISADAHNGGYWKNGSLVNLPDASSVLYLNQSSNKLYASGWDKSGNPAYWVDGTKVNLQSPYNRALFPYQGVTVYNIGNIAISGTNVLVSGNLFFENQPLAPANAPDGNFGLEWNNGNMSLLGKGVLISAAWESTIGIAVAGNDVYIAGRIPDSTRAAGYWKNGVWNTINNGAFLPSSIIASGNNAYIAGATYSGTGGSYVQQAAYWSNGNLVQLPGVVAFSIAVDGNDVYVLGVDNNSNNVVWKNGNLFATIADASKVRTTCISVGN